MRFMRWIAAALKCDFFLGWWELLCFEAVVWLFPTVFFAECLVSEDAEMHNENNNSDSSTDRILTT